MKRIFTSLVVAGLWATAVQAADTPVAVVNQESKSSTEGLIDREVSSVGGLQFSSDQGQAKFTLQASRTDSGRTSDDGAHSFEVWSLLLSGPLGSDGETKPSTALDGLAGSTSLEVKFKQFRTHISWENNTGPICERAATVYADAEAEKEKDGSKRLAVWNAAHQKAECASTWIATNAPDLLDDYQTALQTSPTGKKSGMLIWGGSGKAGSETFKFVEPATLAQRSVEETGWSGKVFVAYRPPGKAFDHSVYTLSYSRGEAWKNRDETTICPPGGAPATCVKGSAGPPVRTDTEVLTFEYQRSLNDHAIAVRVSHDWGQDVSSIEIPVYLFRDKEGGLTGGVQLGWRSDEDEVVAGIFVSKAFSMLEF